MKLYIQFKKTPIVKHNEKNKKIYFFCEFLERIFISVE